MPVTTGTIPDRELVFEHLSSVISALPSTDSLLLTGDWNAALCKHDRLTSGTNSLDTQHAAWVGTQPELRSVYTIRC
jgi:hypothetical protein